GGTPLLTSPSGPHGSSPKLPSTQKGISSSVSNDSPSKDPLLSTEIELEEPGNVVDMSRTPLLSNRRNRKVTKPFSRIVEAFFPSATSAESSKQGESSK